jgi:hypothetical protein
MARGERLDDLIAEVDQGRAAQGKPPLTRPEAVGARKLAADALAVGWDPRLVVAALIATAAFTTPAFSFAVDKLRRQVVGEPTERLTKAQIALARRRGG